MIAMMVVVLPAPLGPSSASTVPAGTSMLRPWTTRMAPYPQLNRSSRSMLLLSPEICGAHSGVGYDVIRRAIPYERALIEHKKTPAHTHHFCQVVLDQHHGDASGID